MATVFIQSNNKQLLGAKVAAYALKKHSAHPETFGVEILNTDTMPLFQSFRGKTFYRSGLPIVYDPDDLQSFTLSRFLPPERMGYQGRAVVIDPDIFAIADITELLNLDLQGKAIAACTKKNGWDTSVMVLDCAQLRHWNVAAMLDELTQKKADYHDFMSLKREKSVLELSRLWNSLDYLDAQTKMLHTTERLTQPWKTGLKIDFTRNPMQKLFGIIPREWIHKLLGKYPSHYQPHPDKNIEAFFFTLLGDAVRDGAIEEGFITAEITKKHIRADALQVLDVYSSP